MFRKRGIIYPYIWKFNEIVDGKRAPRLFIIQLGWDLGVVLALCKRHLFFIWNDLLPPSQPLFPAMPGNIWLQLGIYGSNRAAMTGAVLCQLTAVFFFPEALRACSQGNIDIWDQGMGKLGCELLELWSRIFIPAAFPCRTSPGCASLPPFPSKCPTLHFPLITKINLTKMLSFLGFFGYLSVLLHLSLCTTVSSEWAPALTLGLGFQTVYWVIKRDNYEPLPRDNALIILWLDKWLEQPTNGGEQEIWDLLPTDPPLRRWTLTAGNQSCDCNKCEPLTLPWGRVVGWALFLSEEKP